MKTKPTNQQFQLQLEQMADELRNEIHSGTYPDNSFLPSESALAKRFQLSNKSVRKGIEKLVEEGLIVKIPKVGNKVKVQRPGVTLTLGITYTIERDFGLSRLLDDFHRLHPWIRVHTTPYGDLPQFVETGEYRQPDVFAIDSTQFQELKEEGEYEGLEPLLEPDDVFPFLNDAFRVEGQQYVLPVVFSPIVLCYNRTHFKESGLAEPHGGWTWDDLERSAKRLSEYEGRFGFCFDIRSENRWPILLLQSGERFQWEGTRLSNIRGKKLLEGIKLGKRIIRNRDIFPPYLFENNDEIFEFFKEGKVSMSFISYMAMNDFINADLDYDISPLPYMDEPRTLVVVIGVGINRFSRNKEAARLLIDYFGSKRAHDIIREYTLSIPAGQPTVEPVKKVEPVPSRHGLYREIISSCRFHSELNFPWRLNRVLGGQLKAYWADLLNEEELCDRLVDKMSVREEEHAGH